MPLRISLKKISLKKISLKKDIQRSPALEAGLFCRPAGWFHSDDSIPTIPCSAGGSTPALPESELSLANAAQRAAPIVRETFEGHPGGYTTLTVTLLRVIQIAAPYAHVFFHISEYTSLWPVFTRLFFSRLAIKKHREVRLGCI